MTNSLLSIESLSLALNGRELLFDINLAIAPQECVALVGESGSGKTLTALSIPQLLPRSARISRQSRIYFEGTDLLSLSMKAMTQLRGTAIAVVFQDAMASFNPVKTIGWQMREMIQLHQPLRKRACLIKAGEILNDVGVNDVERTLHAYPHELSGGMLQRILIAMSLLNAPKLIIADEPTTALDAIRQVQLLELLKSLQSKYGFSILFISHDLGVVSRIADRIAVMKSGRVLESHAIDVFDQNASCAYTRDLIAAIPSSKPVLIHPVMSEPILKVQDLTVRYPIQTGHLFRQSAFEAVSHITFEIKKGETLALIGESSSGKSTIAKALVQLAPCSAGKIDYRDSSSRPIMIFQDPYTSFNPSMTIHQILSEFIKRSNRSLSAEDCTDRVRELLKLVEINPNRLHDYPNRFSGGQRQRIAVARALAINPKLLILDEATSALDVSTQKELLNLLRRLQVENGISYLLITHHMSVVAQLAHRVAVMKSGKIVEQGPVNQVLTNPQHRYTQLLLDAVDALSWQPADTTMDATVHTQSNKHPTQATHE